MAHIPAQCDVAVIGAGAAGLAAAATLRAQGADVVVLEAKARIGGRAFTETDTLGVPFDHGCQWLHSASLNPFVPMAEKMGLAVGLDERPRGIWLDGRWATEDEVEDWRLHAERSFVAMESAAGEGRDVAACEIFAEPTRWSALFDARLGMVSGVNADGASTADHANYLDTEENWLVAGGYGALVARWGTALPVSLDTAVSRVDWRGKSIAIETPRGVLSARKVIVTVSTAVLASERVTFDPPLPDWKAEAIEALPLGAANKVAFRFDRDVFGEPAGQWAVYSTDGADAFSFQVRAQSTLAAIGYVGGKFCDALEASGEAEMLGTALDQLKAIYGSAIAGHVVSAAATAWRGDPYIGGAYSAAWPGQAARRRDLAQPIDGRLFFAGEASSCDFFSTAHGAYLSGVAAAEALGD
ncbi:MAG: FAD-dependent oxidoreductase [Alphaproteobacteria bacterium]|nr:FAD-dependent oxidoreductase [Alphaproteobacteria bacterium]